MNVVRFHLERDLERLESYLREQYLENRNMTSWLPERLHDLVYRMDAQYLNQGKDSSNHYIFIWEEEGRIVGCILPDGDTIYISIRNGYEDLYSSMIDYAEIHCRPLFQEDQNGKIDFVVVAHDSLKYYRDILEEKGYVRDSIEDYDNYVYPHEVDVTIDLPEGYKLVYGDEYRDEVNKWSACNLGFHPDLESPHYQNDMSAYQARKKSSMYPDSFECMVIDELASEKNDVCSYCFVYVDKDSKTAFIEPVSTREKYRHRGIGRAMMHGVVLKCEELGIEKCYVNSYDWRRQFYVASGFTTEDTLGYYHKKI